MSETLPSIMPPTPAERVQLYLYDSAVEVLDPHVENLRNPTKPLPDTVVLIPVAAHTEAEMIQPAMQQYAQQKDCKDFAICLFLNYPKGASTLEAEKSEEAVEKAKDAFPQLDIRYSTVEYEQPTIGEIRRDLWDSVLRIAYAEGRFSKPDYVEDVLGINHDIDTLSIDPQYISRIQKHYEGMGVTNSRNLRRFSPMDSRYTQVRHGLSAQHFPNISKGIWLHDFAYKVAYPTGCYEEGMVIPFTYYASRKGFDPFDETHESSKFSPMKALGIPGTSMQTSPRRFIERLDENGFEGIWTPGSFGSDDECRLKRKRVDVSAERLDELLFDALDYHANSHVQNDLNNILDAVQDDEEEGKLSQAQKVYTDPKKEIYQGLERSLTRMSVVSRRMLGASSLYPDLVAGYIPQRYQDTVDRFESMGINLNPRELIL